MAARYCTKCERPVKGHIGQCGDKCTMNVTKSDIEIDSDDSVTFEDIINPVRTKLKKQEQTEKTEDQYNRHVPMAELQKQILDLSGYVQQLALQNQETRDIVMAKMDTAETVRIQTQLDTRPIHNDKPSLPSLPAHCLPQGARVSDTLHRKAISGEFINLADMLTTEITNEYETNLEEGTLQLRPKRLRKSIDCFLTWLQAWNVYEAILVNYDCKLYNKLLAYRSFIQSMDRKYNWSAVFCYDVRFRTELSHNKQFDYDKPMNDLVVTILDATAVKNNISRCFRCRSAEHMVSDCPFPATHPLEKDQTSKTRNQTQKVFKWYHMEKEGCNNFNFGRCHYPGCQRAHVCKACRGPEPYIRCRNCNNNKVTIPTGSLV